MISVFDTQPVILEEKDGHVLTVSRNGLLYKDSNGEVLKDVDFEDVNGILPLRYLNSNISYNLIFRGRNWKNMASELDTDRYNTSDGHNIRETKAIIIAFARHKLTDDFPDNLDTLDLPLDWPPTTTILGSWRASDGRLPPSPTCVSPASAAICDTRFTARSTLSMA